MTRIIKKEECNYLDVARFFGIYLVLLGHFPFHEDNVFIKNMIYTFHMPLFFYISGYLHKQTKLTFEYFKKIVFSLIIPYVIYNLVFLLPHLIKNNFNFNLEILKNIGLVNLPPNYPTWFLATLFWVKFTSLFWKSKTMYIVISVLFICALYAQNFFTYPIFFGIKATFAAFPFFSLGYLLKDRPIKLMKPMYAVLLSIVILFFVILFAYIFGRVDMYTGLYKSIIFILPWVRLVLFQLFIYQIIFHLTIISLNVYQEEQCLSLERIGF